MAEIKAAVEHIITVFCTPLESRGVCIATIQDVVEEAVEYARRYLAIGSDSYKRVWYKLHVCPDAHKWPNLLLLCDLIFSLPFTSSRVEQMFSLLKKYRTSFHTSTLSNLLEINLEGPPLSSFSSGTAVELWWKECCTIRRVNQNPRKEYHCSQCREGEDLMEDVTVEPTLALEDWDAWMDENKLA